ncbi:MAG: hypothetical protein HYY13_12640 [Nitrospirae bacterium]|nr:hypothetical protein [Nitrospirota bacterium]
MPPKQSPTSDGVLKNVRALLRALSLVGKRIARGVSYVLLLALYSLVFPLFSLSARSEMRGPRAQARTKWVERKNQVRTVKDARSP